MTNYGTQFRLTNLLILAIFLCNIFFWKMRMSIYVHCFCQLTPHLQNYSSLWTITFQEDLICYFVSMYVWIEWLSWLDSFPVKQHRSKRSLLNVSLCSVSFIEKFCRAEKCHQSLIAFCKMWLRLSKNMPFNSCLFYSWSCMRRWMQNIDIFSCTQMRSGFSKGDLWLEFLSYESQSRDFF